MDFKQSVMGAVLLAAGAVAGVAQAQLTANVGVYSEYLYRGVEQSNGAAVQGGVDYATDSGFYAGTWLSNLDQSLGFGSLETDVYAGYLFKLNGTFSFDAGLLYYYYADVSSPNTLEAYLGVSAYGATLKAFITDDYFGTGAEAMYFTVNSAYALSDTLSVIPQAGFSMGDGPQALLKDEYADYSVSLVKSLEEGFTFSLGLFGTTLDGDDLKGVLGLKKAFGLM